MHRVKTTCVIFGSILLLASTGRADFNITIPDATFISDGINPTTGSFTIQLEVDGVGAPNVGDPISSYNFQLDVTSVGGGLTTVSSLTPSVGDLFAGVTSQEFLFSPFSQGVTPLGYSEGASTIAQPSAPAPATLNTPVVLTNIAFSVPAGQEGTFTVDFPVDAFEIFDDAFPTADLYAGVTTSGGTMTITPIPEPNAFLLLGLVGCVWVLGKKLLGRKRS